jgi:uncharacterized membrane protein YraQ (UPF0718 family)
MTIAAPAQPRFIPRAYYLPALLVVIGLVLLSVFWLTSRYPSLLGKLAHVGQTVPSMAYSSELIPVAPGAPLWQVILFGAINWINGMKIGMTFGVLFGALLHTVLRHYPLKVGSNVVFNAFKGAMIGVPMGVCANCAVPAACGVTRGNARVEVALGFLFSSPNFNPVVMVMTFVALPWTMGVTKYAVLLFVILVVVPALIRWLERDTPRLAGVSAGAPGSEACAVEFAPAPREASFSVVLKTLAAEYARNVWMLAKPTIAIMLVASLAASALLVLVPWQQLLAEVTPVKVLLLSLISVFMPVPIALDVMFAAQLQQQGVAPGYVMLFAMTLGTFSIVPAIYLWREVSKRLSMALFGFFVLTGSVLALLF